MAIRSRNVSSGQNVTNVTANSERGENIRITALFENASGRNVTLHVLNTIDETRNKIPEEVSKMSVPGTHFDRQPHTHHIVTGEKAQTNQIPEFLTGRTLTPRKQQSHQQQDLSTQLSKDIKLPLVEYTPKNQNSDSNNSSNCLFEAIGGVTTQQRPQAATMPKLVSTNKLIFDDKKREIWTFWRPVSHNAQNATREDKSKEK